MRVITVAAITAIAAALAPNLSAEPVKILVSSRFVEALKDFEIKYPDLELIPFAGADAIAEKIADADAIIGLPSTAPNAELVNKGKKLRWMQTTSAGVERQVQSPELVASDIILTNCKIIQGPEIADHAFALLLNFTRGIKAFNEQMKQGYVRRSPMPLIELRGKTVVVIGYGGIGTQIAQRAAAFGMSVIAVDPKDMPLTRNVTRFVKPDELDQVLPEADVVISAVPHTRNTQGMIGARQFEAMKDGVYFINVSRGAIVQTEALADALRSGKVLAAGLDVTAPEPLPKEHPLWSMPNVTITPHLATASDQLEGRRTELFRDNLERFMTGRALRHVVDKKRGY